MRRKVLCLIVESSRLNNLQIGSLLLKRADSIIR